MNTSTNGYEICLVRVTGARTGRQRDIPLIHVAQGDQKILVGYQDGMARNPDWVYGVRTHPDIEITVRGRRLIYSAREVTLEQKRALWPLIVDVYPAFDEYQARAGRNIPVFLCEPRRRQ